MTFAIGGTAKVRRVIKGKRLVKWVHACDMLPGGGRVLDSTYKRCPGCGRRRP